MGGYRKNLVTLALLEILKLDVPLMPLEDPYQWLSRNRGVRRKAYRDSLRSLKRSGLLKIVNKQNQEFIKITKKGTLKILLAKAKIEKTDKWDGKWRVLVFDIPEASHTTRDRFRSLLRQNSFIKLQASVFISPYNLNEEAFRYLKESGLIKFIRIMKVEKMDDDLDLRKKFNLAK